MSFISQKCDLQVNRSCIEQKKVIISLFRNWSIPRNERLFCKSSECWYTITSINYIKCGCVCLQLTAGHLGVYLWGPLCPLAQGSLSQCLITYSRLVDYGLSFLKVRFLNVFVLAFWWQIFFLLTLFTITAVSVTNIYKITLQNKKMPYFQY